MKLLSDLRERWNCIFIVEKLLFKKIPTDSADVQEQFQESANEHPELAKWYYFLDGVTDQLTREIVAILSSWSWGVQALRDHVLQARLRHTFAAPSSTKTWNEDVFRDLRATYLNCPDSRVSCWSRQKQSMVSLQNRDRKLIMPVLNSGHASRRSQQAFQNFQHKKLVTNSIFSPATNPAKAKRCQEQGRKFDCGYATKTGLNPLIDLKPLVSPGQGQAQLKKSEAGPSPADTGSLFLLPASKLANYMAASAWSFLDIKRSLFAQHRFGDLETALAKRWIGNFLCCGGVFNIRGRYSLSLGFFGYAAQMCQLNHLEVGEDMYFSLKARRRAVTVRSKLGAFHVCSVNSQIKLLETDLDVILTHQFQAGRGAHTGISFGLHVMTSWKNLFAWATSPTLLCCLVFKDCLHAMTLSSF